MATAHDVLASDADKRLIYAILGNKGTAEQEAMWQTHLKWVGRIARAYQAGCPLCAVYFVPGCPKYIANICKKIEANQVPAMPWPNPNWKPKGLDTETDTCPTCHRTQGQDKAECDLCAKRADRT